MRNRRESRSGCAPAVWLLGVLCACSEEPAAHGPEHGVRAGDSLFERLDEARLEQFPETNLPASLLEVVGESFPMQTLPIEPDQWFSAGVGPKALLPKIRGTRARYWRTRPGLALAPDARPPRIRKDGEPIDFWNQEEEPFPGESYWWSPDAGMLSALVEKRPKGITVDYDAEPAAVFGDVEMVRWPRDGSASGRPDPDLLRRRIELAQTSRRALFLPAPAILSFDLEALAADRLKVAVGVLDRAWQWNGSAVRPAHKLGDGVTFAVEILCDGERERVWSHTVSKDEVGEDFLTASVPLSRYQGRAVQLRLVTEPGPDSNSDFDYAVWSDLRFEGQAVRSPPRPHVVLILLDTLRPDRLGCYGCERETSPRLDRWSEQEAVVFTDCTSTGPWTLPSTASILTGLAVHQHGTRETTDSLPRGIPSLASILSAAGYETIAATGEGFLRPSFGFDAGFDWYHHASDNEAPRWELPLQRLADRDSERPLFLLLHTYFVHAPWHFDDRFEDPDHPYRGPYAGRDIAYDDVIYPFKRGEIQLDEEDRAYIRRLYDAGIARLDEHMGDLFAQLDRAFGDEEFLVVITSDHGEELFERGNLHHGHTLHAELLQVPLIVRFPDRRAGRSDLPASTLDVVPTVLDYAGLPRPPHLPGRSLRPDAADGDALRVAQRGKNSFAVQLRGQKLIRDYVDGSAGEAVELYRSEEDPLELRNVASENPDTVTGLTRLLARFLDQFRELESASGEADLGAETLQSLRDLGYVDD